jgi:hypothetical protein
MELKKIYWKDVDWIHLAQDRDQSQAFLNMVIDGEFEWLCSN